MSVRLGNVLVVLGMLTLVVGSPAQTPIEKSIPAQSGQKVSLEFEDPNLIVIHTWEKQEVKITGNVSINRGENDNAFALDVSYKDGTLRIKSTLKDKENIPHRIVIKKDDTEYYFKTSNESDPEIIKFKAEHGHQYSYMSHGITKDISLEVWVPAGTDTFIESKFGLIEVRDFRAPLKAISKFGGIDAAVAIGSVGELTAKTQFGEILTNLDVKFSDGRINQDGHWTVVSAKTGSGPKYDFESKFGKVYLRRP